MPRRDAYNCIGLQQYDIYTRRSTDTGLCFLKSVSERRVVIQDVDPYVNLTIGVSIVNNAGLKSNVEETVFVGSMYIMMITKETVKL